MASDGSEWPRLGEAVVNDSTIIGWCGQQRNDEVNNSIGLDRLSGVANDSVARPNGSVSGQGFR